MPWVSSIGITVQRSNLVPKFTFVLEAQAFVRGYLDVRADTLEEAQAMVTERIGDVAWHHNGINESAGITADIEGPALYDEEDIRGVQIIPPAEPT